MVLNHRHHLEERAQRKTARYSMRSGHPGVQNSRYWAQYSVHTPADRCCIDRGAFGSNDVGPPALQSSAAMPTDSGRDLEAALIQISRAQIGLGPLMKVAVAAEVIGAGKQLELVVAAVVVLLTVCRTASKGRLAPSGAFALFRSLMDLGSGRCVCSFGRSPLWRHRMRSF